MLLLPRRLGPWITTTPVGGRPDALTFLMQDQFSISNPSRIIWAAPPRQYGRAASRPGLKHVGSSPRLTARLPSVYPKHVSGLPGPRLLPTGPRLVRSERRRRPGSSPHDNDS